MLVDGREIAAFANHAFEFGGEHFGADGSLHDPADLLHRLAIIAGLLRHQRRVRRHAVDDAEKGELLDFLDVAGIHKQLHCHYLLNVRYRDRIAELTDSRNLHRDPSPALAARRPTASRSR